MNRAIWILALLALGGWDVTRRKNADVERGNAHLQRGEIDEAIAAYRKAERELPREPGLHFDLGTALYHKAMASEGKQREALLDEAERELRLGTDAEDPRLRSNVHYNLGNTLGARDRVDEAIQEYKKALRTDPTNSRARHNLELLLREKREREQKPKPQPQPRDPQRHDPSDEDPDPRPEDQPPERLPPEEETPQDERPPQDQPRPETQPQPSASRPDERKPGQDREWKLDALERLSKDLHIMKQRTRARERRLGRPTKDW